MSNKDIVPVSHPSLGCPFIKGNKIIRCWKDRDGVFWFAFLDWHQTVMEAGRELNPKFTDLKDTRVTMLYQSLDDDERGQMADGTLLVNESGLYQFLMQFQSPVAKKFRKWLGNLLVDLRQGFMFDPSASAGVNALRLIQAQVSVVLEHAEKIEKIENNVASLEKRFDEKELADAELGRALGNLQSGYSTVLGMINELGFKYDPQEANRMGKMCAEATRARGLKKGPMVFDGRYSINQWPREVATDIVSRNYPERLRA